MGKDIKKTKTKKPKSEDDWEMIASKSKPGRFYMFNRATGESRKLPNTPHTPAQDRLKRLQHKIKKSKDTTRDNNNSNKESDKNTQKSTQMKLEEKEDDKPTTSSYARMVFKEKMLVNVEDKDLKTSQLNEDKQTTKLNEEKTKSPLKRRSSEKCKLPEKRKSTSEYLASPSSSHNHQSPESASKRQKHEECSPNKEQKRTPSALTVTCSSILPKTNRRQDNEECFPNKKQDTIPSVSTPKRTSTSLRDGIVDKMCKLKEYCKNALYKSVKKCDVTTSASLLCVKKTSSFKIPKRSKSDICTSLAVKETLKELNVSHKCLSQSTEFVSPFDSPSNAPKQNVAEVDSPATSVSTPTTLPIPAYNRGSANARLQNLRRSLAQSAPKSLSSNVSPPRVASNLDQIMVDESNTASTMAEETEAMDWQPIEDSQQDTNKKTENGLKSFNLNVVKIKNTNNCSLEDYDTIGEYYDAVNENLLRFTAEKQNYGNTVEKKWLKDYYYFVIDTNVIMRHLAFIDDLSKMKLCATSGTILYIPYCVLQELDKLKMRSSNEGAKTLAIRAIKYLNENLSANNSHIQAQSAAEEREHRIDVNSADDSIINCCLQVQQHLQNIVLLTEDVNLRNKAICNDILVTTKSDLISKHTETVNATRI